MTQYQSRGNKAPPRTKQPPMLPKLGTALNWVPPKESSITKTQQKSARRLRNSVESRLHRQRRPSRNLLRRGAKTVTIRHHARAGCGT